MRPIFSCSSATCSSPELTVCCAEKPAKGSRVCAQICPDMRLACRSANPTDSKAVHSLGIFPSLHSHFLFYTAPSHCFKKKAGRLCTGRWCPAGSTLQHPHSISSGPPVPSPRIVPSRKPPRSWHLWNPSRTSWYSTSSKTLRMTCTVGVDDPFHRCICSECLS